jgi:hypothetical protein
MDFLNHRKGGGVLYQFFLLSPLKCTVTHYRNCKRLREFEEIDILMQSRKGDSENKENYSDFCLDFVQELGLGTLPSIYHGWAGHWRINPGWTLAMSQAVKKTDSNGKKRKHQIY